MTRLTTQRLTLTAVSLADAPEVHAHLASEYEIIRHTGSWIWPAAPEFTASKCEVGFSDTGGWLVARAREQMIGMIGLQDDGDFGYMLTQPAWGQGYATEMGEAVIDHAAASPNWMQLKACVFDGNDASSRVLHKLGFAEGHACRGHCASQQAELPIRTFTRSVSDEEADVGQH